MPLDAGSVVAHIGAIFDDKGFDSYDRRRKKTEAESKRRIEARLGANVEDKGFSAWERELAKVRATARRGVDARLGARVDDSGFGKFLREVRRVRIQAARAIEQKIKVKTDTSEMSRFSSAVNRAKSSLSGLGGSAAGAGLSLRLLRIPVVLSLLAGLTQALSAAGAGFVALTGTIGSASGALASFAGLGAAAAQGLGVWKLATDGIATAVGGLNQKLADTKAQKQAFRGLSAEAKDFARELERLKPKVLDLTHVAQRGLLPGLSMGLREALRNFPVLERVVDATAKALGRMAASAGKALGGREWGRDIEIIGLRNVSILEKMGSAAGHAADALRHIWVAAGPTMVKLAGDVDRLAAGLEHAAQAGRKSGRLGDAFERSRRTLHQVSRLIADVAVGLYNIAKIGDRELGGKLLGSLERAAANFRKFTESASGRNKIADYFRRSEGPVKELGRLVRDVGKAFLEIGASRGAEGMIRTIRTRLLPAVTRLIKTFGEVAGPEVVNALASLADLFAAIAPSTAKVARGVAKVVEFLTDVIRKVPGLNHIVTAMLALGAAVTAVRLLGLLTGLRALTGLLGGLGGRAGKAKGALGALAGVRFHPLVAGAAAAGVALYALWRDHTKGARHLREGAKLAAEGIRGIAPAAQRAAAAQRSEAAQADRVNKLRREGKVGTREYAEAVDFLKQKSRETAAAEDAVAANAEKVKRGRDLQAQGIRESIKQHEREIKAIKDTPLPWLRELLRGEGSERRRLQGAMNALNRERQREQRNLNASQTDWVNMRRAMNQLAPVTEKARNAVGRFTRSFKGIPGFKRVILEARDRDAVAKVASLGNRLTGLGKRKTVARILANASSARDAAQKLDRYLRQVVARKREAKLRADAKQARHEGQGIVNWIRRHFGRRFTAALGANSDKAKSVLGSIVGRIKKNFVRPFTALFGGDAKQAEGTVKNAVGMIAQSFVGPKWTALLDADKRKKFDPTLGGAFQMLKDLGKQKPTPKINADDKKAREVGKRLKDWLHNLPDEEVILWTTKKTRRRERGGFFDEGGYKDYRAGGPVPGAPMGTAARDAREPNAHVAPGEAVLTGHQQRFVNEGLAARFGMTLSDLFSKIRTPHWAPSSPSLMRTFAEGGAMGRDRSGMPGGWQTAGRYGPRGGSNPFASSPNYDIGPSAHREYEGFERAYRVDLDVAARRNKKGGSGSSGYYGAYALKSWVRAVARFARRMGLYGGGGGVNAEPQDDPGNYDRMISMWTERYDLTEEEFVRDGVISKPDLFRRMRELNHLIYLNQKKMGWLKQSRASGKSAVYWLTRASDFLKQQIGRAPRGAPIDTLTEDREKYLGLKDSWKGMLSGRPFDIFEQQTELMRLGTERRGLLPNNWRNLLAEADSGGGDRFAEYSNRDFERLRRQLSLASSALSAFGGSGDLGTGLGRQAIYSLQQGGVIPGTGHRDMVPLWGQPGERMMTRDAQSGYGGVLDAVERAAARKGVGAPTRRGGGGALEVHNHWHSAVPYTRQQAREVGHIAAEGLLDQGFRPATTKKVA